MAIVYRILQGIVIVALALLLWFFIVGLGDGSIDGSNMGLWLVLLAIPLAALVASWHLWANRRRGLACVLLAVPAAPAAIYGLFIALFIILQPRF